jgi:hypothetical protein
VAGGAPGRPSGLHGLRTARPEPAVAEQRATYIASSFGLSDDVAAMREEPTWTFRELKTGHWPMVSAPERIVVLLDEVTFEHG